MKRGSELRIGFFVFLDESVPFFFQLRTVFDGVPEMRKHLFWNVKTLVLGQAEISFCFFYGIFARSVGMGFRRSLLRHSKADDRVNADQRRLVLYLLRVLDRLFDGFQIVAVRDLRHVPAGRLETLCPVFGKREIGRTVDRDLVVVVEIDQIAELQMPGKRRGFVADAFHQIAVRADAVDKIIDDRKAFLIELCRKMCLGDAHPDTVRKTLSQRPGRYLDARRQNILRVPRRFRMKLAEIASISSSGRS